MDVHRLLGPYRLRRELGAGGMGVVWEAEHAETGARVALKTVRVPDPRMLHGLRREIDALTRLRHPGVARVLDHGVADGVPWYAMVLVEGRPLRDWVPGRSLATATDATPVTWLPEDDDAPTGSDRLWTPGVAAGGRLGEVLTLVARLCEPLAWLHGEGVVHRDVKPDNALVTDGNRPVLVDFGLAVDRADRDTLDGGPGRAGTTRYLAPEVWLGNATDARADLYALGCTLYELVAGVPPFRSPDLAGLRRAHVAEEPRPLSQRVAGVPPGLDALVASLLAKSPARRPGHALDVARALEELGAEPGPLVGPPPRVCLFRPRFAGRESVVEALRAASHGPGRSPVVLVAGESGSGKTRLALELAASAPSDVIVSTGGASSAGGAGLGALAGPLTAAAEALRGRAGELEPAIAALAPYSPALAALTPSVRPPALGRDDAILRVWRALAEVLSRRAAPRRAWLVLDDLQWADPLTLGFLGYVARSAPAGLSVLGLHRAEEGALDELRRAPGVAAFALGPLGGDVVQRLTADMLGGSPPPGLAGWIADRAAGNPFFAAQYLRAAVDEGLLARGSGGWVVGDGVADRPDAYDALLALPGSVRALVERRIAALGSEARDLLRLAVVFGRTFDYASLARAWGRGEAALEPLGELLRRGVLEDAGPGRYRFSHDALLEVALAGLPEGERAGLHARVAEAWAEVAPAATLASHWDRAGRPDRARPFHRTAAKEAVARLALAEARRHDEAFLAGAAPDDPDAIEVAVALAVDVLAPTGDADAAAARLAEAAEAARRIGRRDLEVRATLEAAMVEAWRGRADEARRVLESVRADPSAAGALAARATHHLGNVVFKTGDLAGAEGLLVAAAGAWGRLGERREQALALLDLASVYQHFPLPDRVRALVSQATALAPGDPVVVDLSAGVEAWKLTADGDLDGAVAAYEQAIAWADKHGLLRRALQYVGNMAHALHKAGRPDACRRAYQRGIALAREMGNQRFELQARMRLGQYAVLEGRAGEGLDALTAVVPELAALQDWIWWVQARRYQALALRCLGRPEEGAALLREAEPVADRIGPVWAVGVRADLAGLCLDCGAVDEAERWAAMVAAATTGADDRWRTSYESAVLARRGRGDLARAEALLDQADALGPSSETARLLLAAERGFLALARGESADPWLGPLRAARIAEWVYPNHELTLARDALERSAAARPEERLVGELRSALPAALAGALSRAAAPSGR